MIVPVAARNTIPSICPLMCVFARAVAPAGQVVKPLERSIMVSQPAFHTYHLPASSTEGHRPWMSLVSDLPGFPVLSSEKRHGSQNAIFL